MNSVAAAQEGPVDVEEIRVLRVPGKTWLDGDTRFIRCLSCQHVLSETVSLGGSFDVPRYIQDVRCGVDA
jgi:hypothetical protein